jgi:hypothetical protein
MSRGTTMIKYMKSSLSDVTAYNIPVDLIKFCIKAIRAWCSVALELVGRIGYLSFSEVFVEVVIHLRVDLVSHHLNSFLHIGWFRRCEELCEIVLKDILNFFVMAVTVALTIIYEINFVLSLSLSSLVVEVV